ncbi:hypothetical protein PVAND_008438 [Polypedilum vanderplanki]|uniref:Innexin n=1 Tax=Polypedilum vanderplanki TaxID=319348 RepID=A0A9J6C9I9_POLVA|nr:hypothetical protein PVAND_008438 [Polypedilum vanderplanki]
MFYLFESLKSLTRLHQISIDNLTFKIHYRVTFLILVICSILITSYQYWGKPISCLTEDGDAEQYILDFCWVASTFTIPKFYDKKGQKDVVAPGVGGEIESDEKKYHTYYQWVCIVLFAQAIVFYLPHYLWKNWEGNKLKYLVQDLQNPILDVRTKKKQIIFAVQSFKRNCKNQKIYAYKFIFCEVLNFINVFWQMRILNNFLGGEFSTYGTDVWDFLSMDQSVRTDPMVKIFPKLTKCNYFHYGTTGSIQKRDALCNLPLNNLNEKIFVFLWFWFNIVIFFTFCQLLLRFISFISPDYRALNLTSSRNSEGYNDKMKYVLINCDIGGWFLLYMIKKNINEFYFEEIINKLAKIFYQQKRNLEKEKEKQFKNNAKKVEKQNILNSQNVQNIIQKESHSYENEKKTLNGNASVKSNDENSVYMDNSHYMETIVYRRNSNRTEDGEVYELAKLPPV